MDKLSVLLKPLSELLEIQTAILERPVTEPLHQTVRMIIKEMTNSLAALSLLALNGYGNNALKIARGIYEGGVTVSYLVKNPNLLDDFVDFDWVLQKRSHDHFEMTDPSLLQKVGSQKVNEVEENFNRVKARFTGRKGKVRRRWCKVSLRQMAMEVGRSSSYPSFYGSVSSMHHLDARGLALQLGESKEGRLDITTAPSERWVKSALQAGYTDCVVALQQYTKVANVGSIEVLENNLKEFMEGLDILGQKRS